MPDDIHQGIKVLAAERKVSLNKLYEEISGVILRGYTAEARFRERVAQGSQNKGLVMLDALDEYYRDSRPWDDAHNDMLTNRLQAPLEMRRAWRPRPLRHVNLIVRLQIHRFG